jgi:hypothetical protein
VNAVMKLRAPQNAWNFLAGLIKHSRLMFKVKIMLPVELSWVCVCVCVT